MLYSIRVVPQSYLLYANLFQKHPVPVAEATQTAAKPKSKRRTKNWTTSANATPRRSKQTRRSTTSLPVVPVLMPKLLRPPLPTVMMISMLVCTPVADRSRCGKCYYCTSHPSLKKFAFTFDICRCLWLVLVFFYSWLRWHWHWHCLVIVLMTHIERCFMACMYSLFSLGPARRSLPKYKYYCITIVHAVCKWLVVGNYKTPPYWYDDCDLRNTSILCTQWDEVQVHGTKYSPIQP